MLDVVVGQGGYAGPAVPSAVTATANRERSLCGFRRLTSGRPHCASAFTAISRLVTLPERVLLHRIYVTPER